MDKLSRELAKIASSPRSWAEAFLKNPDTGETFETNYIQDKLFDAKSKKVVMRCHRRGGKSVGLSVLALWGAFVHNSYEVLVVGPSEDQVMELFDKMREFINLSPLVKNSVRSITKTPNHRITFANGSTIKGKTTGTQSNKGGMTIRGKGADMVIIDEAAYLSEDDFTTLNAIILGDRYREEVLVYAASTPNEKRNSYYRFCKDKTLGWDEIHVPLDENPDIPESMVRDARAMYTEVAWITEALAEFLDVGANAIRQSDIDTARKSYSYPEKEDLTEPLNPIGVVRAMGVDWDTIQAGVNIVVVEWIPGTVEYKLVYREEVPRGDYTLTRGVQRIIGLNTIFNPSWIYIDRGYGEHQIETLKLYGEKHPETKLKDRVKGFSFAQNVPIKDPIDGSIVQRQLKAVIIKNLTKLFEDNQFWFSDKDLVFESQLRNYLILSSGPNSIKTTRKNEHIIDAAALACYALSSNLHDSLKFKPASKSYVLDAPKVVRSEASIARDREIFEPMAAAIQDRQISRGFSRGGLMTREPRRSSF